MVRRRAHRVGVTIKGQGQKQSTHPHPHRWEGEGVFGASGIFEIFMELWQGMAWEWERDS